MFLEDLLNCFCKKFLFYSSSKKNIIKSFKINSPNLLGFNFAESERKDYFIVGVR